MHENVRKVFNRTVKMAWRCTSKPSKPTVRVICRVHTAFGDLSPHEVVSAAHAGEQGAHIVDLVRKNPAVSLGVVLPRLLQKDEEW